MNFETGDAGGVISSERRFRAEHPQYVRSLSRKGSLLPWLRARELGYYVNKSGGPAYFVNKRKWIRSIVQASRGRILRSRATPPNKLTNQKVETTARFASSFATTQKGNLR